MHKHEYWVEILENHIEFGPFADEQGARELMDWLEQKYGYRVIVHKTGAKPRK